MAKKLLNTWFCCLASTGSSLLFALHHCETAGPTMSHHFSSVNNQQSMRCSSSSSVNCSKFLQNISLFFCCEGVRTSVCQGLVQRKSKSLQIHWMVFVDIEIPRSTSSRCTFGQVVFPSLNSRSHNSTISAFFRFVERRFSLRRSRMGS